MPPQNGLDHQSVKSVSSVHIRLDKLWTTDVARPIVMDLTGVPTIQPQARCWNATRTTPKNSVTPIRAQVPLLPDEAMHLAQSAREDC